MHCKNPEKKARNQQQKIAKTRKKHLATWSEIFIKVSTKKTRIKCRPYVFRLVKSMGDINAFLHGPSDAHK